MQAQNASKTRQFIARIGLRNLIWGGIFAGLLLTAAAIWLWSYRDLPTATGREANDTLPWQTGSLTVEEVRGHWRSSEGHARMELRAALYPVARLTLGEGQGSGMLYVRFTDSAGKQAGDIISLPYRDGSFVPRTESNINASGKTAEVYVEAGFESKDYFTLHQINEHSALWRIQVACMPEGTSTPRLLGFVTIPAEQEGGES